MPIFGKKDKQGNRALNLMHTDGVFGIPSGMAVCVTMEDKESRLSIAQRLSKNPPIYLCYDQICAADVINETEIKERGKSVIGRAAVGGLLLGPLGAVIGGISGTGTKKRKEEKNFFVINYHPTDASQETKVLSFEIVGASLHWSSFVSELKTKIPQKPGQSQPSYL